ncbi:hypothetical protein BKA62DRAFT_197504 [Auriculariales sp. MPI-PUGE-AT-0066]|nr:hypothetical protein BKA62DRAFT_197504 [Auriculariales sp. MPI-PUGE-AT-0066]
MFPLSSLFAVVALYAASVAAQNDTCGCEATRVGGKRGLAWPSDNNFDPAVFKTSSNQVTWLYDWGVTPPAKLGTTFPFYVMQWDEQGLDKLNAAVEKADPEYVLFINEPDNGGQANLSAADAAKYWKQYAEPLRQKGFKLGSPAYTNAGAPEGVAWMDEFVKACTNCTWDVTAVHWYGGWTTDLKEHIDASKKYGKPIWLTEFALSWDAQVANYEEFLPLALQYLDGESAVTSYAFFGAFHSGGAWDMLTADGQLTSLGKIYVA